MSIFGGIFQNEKCMNARSLKEIVIFVRRDNIESEPLVAARQMKDKQKLRGT